MNRREAIFTEEDRILMQVENLRHARSFKQLRKRAARRILRKIDWQLTRLYRGWSVGMSEQKLLDDRGFYEGQLEHQKNIFAL